MGKFTDKEAERVEAKSTAKAMSSTKSKATKRLVSFQAADEMYKKFTYINEQMGVSNTTVLNLYIADYVKEHSDLI